METGEVVRSEGSPQGLGVHRQRPAQPLPEPLGEQTSGLAAPGLPESPEPTRTERNL
jgi:hypothetical protein